MASYFNFLTGSSKKTIKPLPIPENSSDSESLASEQEPSPTEEERRVEAMNKFRHVRDSVAYEYIQITAVDVELCSLFELLDAEIKLNDVIHRLEKASSEYSKDFRGAGLDSHKRMVERTLHPMKALLRRVCLRLVDINNTMSTPGRFRAPELNSEESMNRSAPGVIDFESPSVETSPLDVANTRDPEPSSSVTVSTGGPENSLPNQVPNNITTSTENISSFLNETLSLNPRSDARAPSNVTWSSLPSRVSSTHSETVTPVVSSIFSTVASSFASSLASSISSTVKNFVETVVETINEIENTDVPSNENVSQSMPQASATNDSVSSAPSSVPASTNSFVFGSFETNSGFNSERPNTNVTVSSFEARIQSSIQSSMPSESSSSFNTLSRVPFVTQPMGHVSYPQSTMQNFAQAGFARSNHDIQTFP